LSIDDRRKSLAEFNKSIEQASSVLIAGGGIVGIELLGELAVKYAANKQKKIGLCIRGERLLPNMPPKAGRIADEFLRSKGVEIHYKTPFNEKTAQEKGYQLAI
jgi:NADH dehydrogenase FAD-containing subunit